MCGRYLITSNPEAVRALFRYREQPNFPPRYNIAPTQPVPIVRLWQGQRQFALVRWGLIPSWVKDPETFSLLINARAESVVEKPAFRAAMKRRRCLFPADGFYEWQAGGGRKRPFAVLPAKEGPVAFAGLWETWTGPNGEEVETAAIITVDANKSLRPIHHRMPALIMPEAFDMWLDVEHVDAEVAAAMLTPAPEHFFKAHEISAAVNRVANDSAAILTPVAQATLAAGKEASSTSDGGAAAPRTKTRGKRNADQGSLF
jgi:putative SOS response-associated peptidase YedK